MALSLDNSSEFSVAKNLVSTVLKLNKVDRLAMSLLLLSDCSSPFYPFYLFAIGLLAKG